MKGIISMFKVSEFLNVPYEEEQTIYRFNTEEWEKSKLYGQEFLLRRVNGIEMLHLTSFQDRELELQIPYILGVGVLDADSKRPIGNKIATELVRRHYRESTRLFSTIMNFSQGMTDVEEDAIEEERKNLEQTDSQSSTISSANGSDSIQEQQ